jgi:protein ImuB
VLAGRDGRRRSVTALDANAERLGLSVGMALARAQALVPGLIIMDADSRGDAEALERLALWALRFSPIVTPDPPDGLAIDTTGADHLHGGEAVMLTAMVHRFAAAGIEVRAAIADTKGAAHAFARFTRKATVIIPPGEGEPLLRRLPLAALRLEASVVTGLQTLGFERIGDLMDQPRAPLTQRFGPEIGRRLDEALGRSAEPIEPIRSPELPQARRVFAEPIGAAETIARYTGQLVVALCADMETKGLGARRLDLLFTRVDNSMQAVRIGLARPVRDVKRLTRLLCDKIETVDPGFGIELMTLVASAAEPLDHLQTISSLVEEAEPDVSDLVDILANRVGGRRIYRYASVASDVPERSVVRISPFSQDQTSGWNGNWPRPSRLFPRPEPIETMALLPDHPPIAFVWRGTRRRVRRADGPERVFGEWWKRDAEMIAVRDYFRVEDCPGGQWRRCQNRVS